MTDAAVEEADSGRRWRSSVTGPAPADAGPVLLLCPSLFSIRNVLHSRLLPGLRELGHRVEVLGLPGAGPVAFAEPGPDQRFSEIDLAPRKRVTGAAALGIIQNASFYRRHRLTTDRLTQWWYRRHEGVWRRVQYGMLEAAGAVGAWDPLYRWQMRRLATLRLAGGTWPRSVAPWRAPAPPSSSPPAASIPSRTCSWRLRGTSAFRRSAASRASTT